ncbi:hypothetical protein [Cupriavidus agavae]|uniref:DUF465 domain-containing protein n=1 Tax=Cupriavidus agavae TaxID=1001822 RepID=A0A4Q7S9K6_9BURK|nr:hypothetical protein [Cupriavidus agavae]RZT42490.1 hypothetical protein EV147_1526 [Cupriavidus agavae]
MQKGKMLRDLIVLDRYIAEREAELRRTEIAARQVAHPAGTPPPAEPPEVAALRRTIYVLRARRDTLNGQVKRVA